jgi:DNA-binding phage protein
MKLKKNAQVIEYSPTQELLDETFIAKAVWECLKNNDPEGVIEIIETHLEIINKAKNAQKNDLSRSTMYHALKGKNPTIKTLAKMVNCFSTAEHINEDCCIAH